MRTKAKLFQRLEQYYKQEGFHTVWISFFAIYLNLKYGFFESLLLNYGLLLVVIILAQGTYFWMIKFRYTNGTARFSAEVVQRFIRFKYINICIIILYPLFVVYLNSQNQFAMQENKSWAIFAYAFGLAEYINYYHIQLMYDNKNDWNYLRRYKRLKEAHLSKLIA